LLRCGEEFVGAGLSHFVIFSSTRMSVKHPFHPVLMRPFVSRIPAGDIEKDRVSWTN
jgi:hypothetical protein